MLRFARASFTSLGISFLITANADARVSFPAQTDAFGVFTLAVHVKRPSLARNNCSLLRSARAPFTSLGISILITANTDARISSRAQTNAFDIFTFAVYVTSLSLARNNCSLLRFARASFTSLDIPLLVTANADARVFSRAQADAFGVFTLTVPVTTLSLARNHCSLFRYARATYTGFNLPFFISANADARIAPCVHASTFLAANALVSFTFAVATSVVIRLVLAKARFSFSWYAEAAFLVTIVVFADRHFAARHFEEFSVNSNGKFLVKFKK